MMDWGFWALVVVLGGVAVWWLASQPKSLIVPPSLSGHVRHVVDGDSLYLDGHKAQIRLWGVDAPELGQRGFDQATGYLSMIAKGRRITCQQIDRDQYGRTVARCFLEDGRELNRMMIESGTAKEYRRFSKGFYSG